MGLLAALATRRPERRAAAPPPEDEELAMSEALGPLLRRLRVLLDDAERDPASLGRHPELEDLLTLGYGIVRDLEDERRRLADQIDELVEAGGPRREQEIVERARSRRQIERQEGELRSRLDALVRHAQRAGLRGEPPHA
jgi:hypothetical protein